MDYATIINGMKRFGSTEKEICLHGIGVPPEEIHENVVLAPWWEPSTLPDLGKAEFLNESDYSAVKVWKITAGKTEFSYIRTGIGAPVLMDAVLTLGLTRCKKIIFIGSVGSLDEKIGIGDIVIPEYSVSGDGASRYIATGNLKDDCWGEKVYPDKDLLSTIKSIAKSICQQNNVQWHLGRVFSIDTVIAQYTHIDTILNMGSNVIEMETAAAFRGQNWQTYQ